MSGMQNILLPYTSTEQVVVTDLTPAAAGSTTGLDTAGPSPSVAGSDTGTAATDGPFVLSGVASARAM